MSFFDPQIFGTGNFDVKPTDAEEAAMVAEYLANGTLPSSEVATELVAKRGIIVNDYGTIVKVYYAEANKGRWNPVKELCVMDVLSRAG